MAATPGAGNDHPSEGIGFSFAKPPEPGPTADAAADAAGLTATPGGSSGDDRPTEKIGIGFTQPGGPFSPKPLSEDTSGPVGTAGAAGGSSEDDRPTEEIGFSHTKPQEPGQLYEGFAESAVIKPSEDGASFEAGAGDGLLFASGADGADHLDFSGVDTARLEGADDALSFEASVPADPREAADDAFAAAVGSGPDRTGDGIADIVPAPQVSLDDFLA
ncbi:hypothetical protein [Ancylobacter lacus]|uniref:hypothetical protein n=1 Tax=Ancylobacter lacus TaxID=2579970 RepID=UPI001BD19F47|nr:hypothetical protein [Ancylobacter lacus]MBS7538037.1 hypothetical protein [Ancylobacter lacus]